MKREATETGSERRSARPLTGKQFLESIRDSREVWSGFVDLSSVRLPLPPGAQNLAWRVTAVARGSASYTVSSWSVFTIPPS